MSAVVGIAATGLGTFVSLAPVVADTAHPIRVSEHAETGEPSPYVLVRGALEARIARAPFYELVDLAVERDGVLGVMSSGTFFPLGPAG